MGVFDELKDKAESLVTEAKDKAGEFAAEAKDKAGEFAAEAKDKAGELAADAKQGFDKVSGVVQEKVGDVISSVKGGDDSGEAK